MQKVHEKILKAALNEAIRSSNGTSESTYIQGTTPYWKGYSEGYAVAIVPSKYALVDMPDKEREVVKDFVEKCVNKNYDDTRMKYWNGITKRTNNGKEYFSLEAENKTDAPIYLKLFKKWFGNPENFAYIVETNRDAIYIFDGALCIGMILPFHLA